MSKRTQDYRKIYKQYFGTVPKDTDGRSYDIHHIDGNHNNNSSDNLIAIPIKEHYDKHYAAKDWKACVMIGLRMRLPVEEISMLNSLAAKKRVEEGTHPWTTEKHASAVSDRIKKAVENGNYHMLGGAIQSKAQRRRAAQGIHQWCGPDANSQMLKNGTHPSQLEFVCPHCNVTGKGAANAKRWHFDNCKKRK